MDPFSARRSIATALADFPSPPPGVVTTNVDSQSEDDKEMTPVIDEDEGSNTPKSRKRTASDFKNSRVRRSKSCSDELTLFLTPSK